MKKVLKFGGSSVATAALLLMVLKIVCKRRDRGNIRAVVVSARGRRFEGDVKETDLLIMLYNTLDSERSIGDDVSEADVATVRGWLGLDRETGVVSFASIWELIAAPLREIVNDLGLDLDIDRILAQSKREILKRRDLDFTKSRGEWHMAHIVAALLKLPMVDATETFRFLRSGLLNEEQTLELIAARSAVPFVSPGFYGADSTGWVHTFPRSGSDVSATWMARGLGVDVCEIWGDTPGIYMADPRIIPADEQMVLSELTYREAREAQVQALHEDALRPLREMGEQGEGADQPKGPPPIPIHMRCTTDPDAPGTWIRAERADNGRRVQIITASKGYVAINVYKTGYHDEVGATATILDVLRIAQVPFHHISTGTDGAMIVVPKSMLKNGTLARILGDIRANFKPQFIDGNPKRELAVICLVGQGIRCSFDVMGAAGNALAAAGISEGRFVDAGGSSDTLVIGIDAEHLATATLALHRAFAPKG